MNSSDNVKMKYAVKTLDSVFLTFGESLAAYHFASYLSCKTFKDTHGLLAKQLQSPPNPKTGKILALSMWTGVHARDVRFSPTKVFAIGAKGAEDAQILDALIENLNFQNLWFIVSAFEAYERFFKNFYAALVSLGCVREAKATLRNINPILKSLRKEFPEFEKGETGTKPNLKMWCEIASVFRHCIVHSGGIISENELFRKLSEATGHTFCGKSKGDRERRAMVRRYIKCEKGNCHLQGIDRSRLPGSYDLLHDLTINMMEHLASHACLAYSCAITHFGGTPVWERSGREPWM